jgi:hypothetical protein
LDVDATAKEADEAGAVVCDVEVNRGQGAALRLGYRIAREGGAAYIVTTDADGQYDPAEIPSLLRPIIDGDADFVTGSRRMGSEETRDPIRKAGVRFREQLLLRLPLHARGAGNLGAGASPPLVAGLVLADTAAVRSVNSTPPPARARSPREGAAAAAPPAKPCPQQQIPPPGGESRVGRLKSGALDGAGGGPRGSGYEHLHPAGLRPRHR